MGHFSFDRPSTTPDGATYSRMVTVSKEVVISGARDASGEMPIIEGGTWPFFIDAAGTHVTIQGLHFVHPKAGAIWVYTVSGLTIAYCRIESPEATAEFAKEANQIASSLAGGIFAGGDPAPPNAARPGKPENFSATLAIDNNDIDMGGTPDGLFLGITLFSVGKSPDHEVDIYVSGNNVRNVTEPAINLRLVGGRAHVERNVITTGAVTGGAANPDALRIVGSGSYVIAHNTIDCGWTEGTATGINVFGQSSALPETGAIVADNDVTMSAPDGTVFASNSAAIEIGGAAQGNAVLNNRMHGRAGAALAVVGRNGQTPGNTTFVSNDLQDFQPSLAGVFVDAGVTSTIIVEGPTSIQDHGSGTVVARMP